MAGDSVRWVLDFCPENESDAAMALKIVETSIRRGQQLPAARVSALQLAAARAPYASTLCQADEPLWGGFWQFDVISPGYTLPAAELALLRAVRLDGGWPETTSLPQFLADLQAAAGHPLAGVWSVLLANTPLAVFAAPAADGQVTVVWYNLAGNCLQAGYRTPAARPHFTGLFLQRQPGFPLTAPAVPPPHWLRHLPPPEDGANPLDLEILRHRRRQAHPGEG